MLTIFDQLPAGLLEREARRLHEVLPGPTLLHLPGRRRQPLFVCVLLHGNEDTGWEAVRALLSQHAGQELPRALSVFIGNVAAAAQGVRHLEGQPDYNRIWGPGETPEHRMMRQVRDEMHRREVFASVDVHNNTGLNPHYACVNRLQPRFLHLATLFGRTVVYFIRPKGVQSAAFAQICPAVTIESGQPGQPQGIEHALAYLEACLHLAELPEHPVVPQDIDLFHTVATVKLAPGAAVGLEDDPADLRLLPDIDRMNFQELPPGTPLGWVRGGHSPVQAWNEGGDEVTERFFRVVDGMLRTALPVMPSMLTRNLEVIRQDCLGYLMERLDAARHLAVPNRPPGEAAGLR